MRRGRCTAMCGQLLVLLSSCLLYVHCHGGLQQPPGEMSGARVSGHGHGGLLDGLELAMAITHVHREEGGENSQPMKEEDLVAVIDDVLRDDDKNNDGYIDYAEFAKSLE